MNSNTLKYGELARIKDNNLMYIVSSYKWTPDHLPCVAMPKIGCGMDGLEWPKIKEIIKDIFRSVSVEIKVCCLRRSRNIKTGKAV